MNRCYKCMKEYDEDFDMCPYCGYEKNASADKLYFLSPGVVLADRYEIGVSIGSGGFGIMYKAWDRVLEKVVAVKEYYPMGLVNRSPGQQHLTIYSGNGRKEFFHGKTRFLEEAKNMAKFDNHPNIVSVFDFFEENNTAYFVMELLQGIDYKQYIAEHGGTVPLEFAVEITRTVLKALAEVHRHGIVHRDISPDNVFLCQDGKVKLIDFGTARFSSTEEELRSVEVKWEFAPPEQYQKKSKQGPWTDVYAVGAMFYKAVTGVEVQSSQDRVENDQLVPPMQICKNMDVKLNNIILRAMALQPELRFQTAEEFIAALDSDGKIRNAKEELRQRKIRRLVSIASIVVCVGIGALICSKVMNQRKEDAAVLADAAITLWVPGDDTENQSAFDSALTEFREVYPQISLEITYIPEEEYASRLAEALAEDKLPTLFESSSIEVTDDKKLAAVSGVFKYLDTGRYLFLDQYKKYFPSEKQIPLAFTAPVIYLNNILNADKAVEELVADGDYLVLAEDLLTFRNVFTEEEPVTNFARLPETFSDGEEMQNCCMDTEAFFGNETTCLIADTSVSNRIEQVMAGYYSVVFPEADDLVGRFEDCYSISAVSSQDEKAAAVQVLVYLLSETAQDARYVQTGDYLPLNKAMYETYIEVNTAFAELQNEFSKMLMPGEKQIEVDRLLEEKIQEDK